MFLFSIESTNILALDDLSEFLVFKYWDHKCKLESCPLQLYNWFFHASNGTSPVSLLKINLLLGFNLSLSLESTLTNSSPASIYSARSLSGLISNKSLLINSIVLSENVPSRTRAVNSCIHLAIAFKSSIFAFKCQYPPKYFWPNASLASMFFLILIIAFASCKSFIISSTLPDTGTE